MGGVQRERFFTGSMGRATIGVKSGLLGVQLGCLCASSLRTDIRFVGQDRGSTTELQRERSLKFGWIGVELKKEDGCSRGDPEMLYGNVECYVVAPV